MSTFILNNVANVYYQASAGLSTSGAKLLLDCPARYHYWASRRRPDRDAYDFGHIVHALTLGEGEKYLALPYGSWRTKAAQEARDQARAAGLIPCLPADLTTALQCAQAVLGHPQAGPMLTADGDSEVSIWHDDPSGVRLKVRPDRVTRLADGRHLLLDVKTTTDASRDAFSRDAWRFRYYLQGAFYRRVYAATQGLDPLDVPMLFVVVEKTAPYLVALYELDEVAYRMGCEAMDKAIGLYLQCRATGEWPGYPTNPQPLSMPGWAEVAHDQQMETA